MSVAWAGCASSALAPYVPAPTATLEVVNRTAEPREVLVRGYREGVVESGKRARFRFLGVGSADVSAWTADTAAMAPEDASYPRADLELRGGAVVRWVLDGPLPEPPELADLTVTNTLKRHVQVTVGGRPVGPVLAGDTRRFRDVPAGQVTVKARHHDSGFELSARLELPPEGEQHWDVAAAMGEITVVNDSREPMLVTLDGTGSTRVGPGERKVIDDVPGGEHVLKASGTHTGLERVHRAPVSADAPHTWTLSADRSAIDVTNATAEPVELAETAGVEGRQIIPPNGTLRLGDLESGPRTLTAIGLDSGMPYGERFDLVPGQQIRWTVRPIHGTIHVDNRTAGPLELYTDGVWQARLEAGAARTLSKLSPGPHELTAVSPDGRVRFSKTVAAGANRTATWHVSAETAPLMVVNRRLEQMSVYVDARRIGDVAAGATLTFTGIESGPRLLEAVGAKSGETLTHRARFVVRADASAPIERFVLDDPHADLLVTNTSGEQLLGEGVLAVQLEGAMASGSKRLLRVPVGRMTLRLIGGRTGVTYSREISVVDGQVIDWLVTRASGGVDISNELDQLMVVRLDDMEVGRLAPGAAMRIGDVPAGNHELAADAIGAGRSQTVERFVSPGQFTRWTLRPEAGRVIVFNDSDDALLVSLNGSPYGRVEPEARKGFDGLVPGLWQLDAVGIRSGWRRSVKFTLREGATESVLVAPPMAVVVVDNGSGELVKVSVGGMKTESVGPGSTELLSVPSGTRVVQIEGAETGVTRRYRLQLGVDQAHHLDVPPALARLAVVNQGELPLAVRLEDRVLGTVDPGASLVVDDLQPGAWRLRAEDSDGNQTHTDRRKVSAGETTTWKLAAVRAAAEPATPPEDRPVAD